MPNHIKNRFELRGSNEQLEKLIKDFSTFYKSEINRSYDGKLIHKTKGKDYSIGWLDEATGMFSRRDTEDVKGVPSGFEQDYTEEWTRFPDFSKIITPPDCPEYRDEPTQQAVRHHKNNWYNWNCENWGTKWNCYSCEKETSKVFTFETAWSAVPKLVKRMMLGFSDVELVYEWSDEDTGQNCGKMVHFNDGTWASWDIESGSKQAFDLAFKLRPHYKDDYKLVGENYEYVEED